jgi:hypothetical protein
MQTDEKAANGFIHHHPWLLTVDRYALASVHKVLHDALGRPAAAAAVAADPKLLRQDPQHLKQVTHPHRRFSSGWRRIRAPPVSYKSGAQLLRSLQLWRGHLTGGTEGLFVGSTTLRSSSEPSWFERLLSPHSRTMRVADAGVAAHGGHRGRAAARRPATRARHGLPRGAHHARPPAGVSQLGGGAHCAAGQTGASPTLPSLVAHTMHGHQQASANSVAALTALLGKQVRRHHSVEASRARVGKLATPERERKPTPGSPIARGRCV